MYSYIARQPILNVEQETVAFELLFRDGEENCFPDIAPDKATSKIIVENHLTFGIDELTGSCPAYINFHAGALIAQLPTFLDKKKVVIEILEDVEINAELLNACKLLKAKGYTLALDDYDLDAKWDVFFPFIDIIKVDIFEVNILEVSQFVERIKDHEIKLLAEKVETIEEFEQYKALGFTLFQGYFFAKPEVIKKKNIASSKSHIIDLMQHASSSEFDFDSISDVFSRDLGLTYKLLRFINSPSYGPSKEISSLKHALIYIGELELKKFIALLVLADLNEGKPAEIIRGSLVRAKFCERLANIKNDVNNPPKAFLTGMLSSIDGVLDQNINEVMDILPIHNEIKAALINKDNYLAQYLALSITIEKGKWGEAQIIANAMELNEDDYLSAYQESLHWSDDMVACQ